MARDGFEVAVNGINNNYKHSTGKSNGISAYSNGHKTNGACKKVRIIFYLRFLLNRWSLL